MTEKAFTLAEVLITLAIIGVVAAMTIPTLMAKFQEMCYKTAYKKAFNTLSNAVRQMYANDEYIMQDVYSYSFVWGENFKMLSNYVKKTESCFGGDNAACWECSGQAGYYYSSAPSWIGCSKPAYSFIDTAGIAYYLYHDTEKIIVIDTNNFKPPNKLGKDRFSVNFVHNKPDIMPSADLLKTDRWCPDGNCMYSSWLIE